MHVLSVLKSPVQTGDHGDVVLVLKQGLHRGGELKRINTWFVQNSLGVLDLVRVKPTYETGQNRIFLTRKKVAAQNPVRDVHHDQLLVREQSLVGGSRKRRHERQSQVAPLVEMNCLRESFMRVKLHKRNEIQNITIFIFSAFGSFCKYGS